MARRERVEGIAGDAFFGLDVAAAARLRPLAVVDGFLAAAAGTFPLPSAAVDIFGADFSGLGLADGTTAAFAAADRDRRGAVRLLTGDADLARADFLAGAAVSGSWSSALRLLRLVTGSIEGSAGSVVAFRVRELR